MVKHIRRPPKHPHHKAGENLQLQHDRHQRYDACHAEKKGVRNEQRRHPRDLDELPPLDEEAIAEIISIDVPDLKGNVARIENGHGHLRQPRLPRPFAAVHEKCAQQQQHCCHRRKPCGQVDELFVLLYHFKPDRKF